MRVWDFAGKYGFLKDKITRAAVLHNSIDTLMADIITTEPQVSCMRGCAFCCYMKVDITRDEGELIMLRLAQERRDMTDIIPVLEKQRRDDRKDLSYAEKRCAFLSEQDDCSIYSFRPTTCRKHYVASPAADCDISVGEEGKVLKRYSLAAEIMASGAMNASPTSDMPNVLLSILKR